MQRGQIKKIFFYLKHIIKGLGFRGGSDEKIRRMWLGLEIVVADLPPLLQLVIHKLLNDGKIKYQFKMNIEY